MSARKSNELYITRIYDAPVKLVWEAWTDPKQIAQWWGPRGFTHTTKSKDLRPGGKWIYTMHGPDGTDYPNITTYHEVVPFKRLVYDHGGNEEREALFRVTVDFSEYNGKTRMEMVMALPTAEAAKEIKKFIKQAGGNATWDRLAEHLGKESSNKELFIINRVFEAPIETVYDMWTKPEHFAKWMGPAGSKMEFIRADIKVGASSFYFMSIGQDVNMYGRIEYLEISRPHRLVYAQQFCDQHEKITRHPMAPVWPESMLSTVTFHSETPNETRVTVRWEAQGSTTAAELEAFVKERGGMTQGWTGSFDKLEEYLAGIH